jgi:hypothetical protein
MWIINNSTILKYEWKDIEVSVSTEQKENSKYLSNFWKQLLIIFLIYLLFEFINGQYSIVQ